jgi:hypothetical protein
MDIQIKTYVDKEVAGLSPDVLYSIAACYKEVFNQFWLEEWTDESAYAEIKKSLVFKKNRKTILVLAYLNSQIIGFSWLKMTSADYIKRDDMPFILSEKQKVAGIEVIKYWLKIAKQEKVLLWSEMGIKKEYQIIKKQHTASRLMMASVKVALENDYNTLFYWTNSRSATFKSCIKIGWHPIHFYPNEDRIIMKGSAKSMLEFTQRVIKRDPEIFKIMQINTKQYFCR